jgi:hypothetical protein
MAKRKPIYPSRDLTLKVNDVILERLKKLSDTGADKGMRGNVYEEIGLIALRVGIEQMEREDRESQPVSCS